MTEDPLEVGVFDVAKRRRSSAKTLLKADDVGRLLNVSRATVYRWCDEQGLPHLQLGEKAIRFEEAELMKWLASRRQGVRS